MSEGADEQAGGCEQDDGKGDFSGEQSLAQAHGAACRGAARRACGDRRAQVDFARNQRWKHAKEKTGQERNQQGEAEDGGIERDVLDGQEVLREQGEQTAEGEPSDAEA